MLPKAFVTLFVKKKLFSGNSEQNNYNLKATDRLYIYKKNK